MRRRRLIDGWSWSRRGDVGFELGIRRRKEIKFRLGSHQTRGEREREKRKTRV